MRDQIKRSVRNALMVTLGVCTPQISSSAQDGSGSTLTYEQAYFSPYKPVSLRDMIQQVPGGSGMLKDLDNDENNARGFGSNGPQILINGKRISGKSNNTNSQLTRILASQVVRIDLIRGNAEGLDVKSNGILYNVILKEGTQKATNFFKVQTDYIKGRSTKPRLLVSRNGTLGKMPYSLTYDHDAWIQRERFDENHFTADRVFSGFRRRFADKTWQGNKFSGDLQYDFDNGDSLRLNGLYKISDFAKTDLEDIHLPLGDNSLQLDSTVSLPFEEDQLNWEFGGDYETRTSLGSLKFIFVINRETFDAIEQGFSIKGVDSVLQYENIIHKARQEKILRTTLNSQLSDQHSLETGAEIAFNSLDKNTNFSDAVVQNPDSKVKETRVEVFATHNYKVTNKLNLQTTLNSEYSRIGQVGSNINQMRTFFFLKPRIEVRYDFSDHDQLRLLVERKISQLNFGNFVAEFDDDLGRVTEGNPDLVPEKTWETSLTYEKRFADDKGSAEVKVFYDKTTDHIDVVEITPGNTGTGNIGDAFRYGIQLKSDLRLGFMGLDDAILSVLGRWHKTEVTDPFTREKRQFQWWNNTRYTVAYRHNLPKWNLSWGFDLEELGRNGRTTLTVRDINRGGTGLQASAYAEYSFNNAMKLKLKGFSLFNDPRDKSRQFFVDDIRLGITDHFEEQQRFISRKVMISLEGSF
ncbi:MAG: hypothetical protein COB54_09110 [Alphaproteobacteria bacterium]|nr:MAG: hypothetical protein COB54_09110 [Alphaproteobacteria bacterium]